MTMGEIVLVCWADGRRNRNLVTDAIEDVRADFEKRVWAPLLRPPGRVPHNPTRSASAVRLNEHLLIKDRK